MSEDHKDKVEKLHTLK